MGTSTQASPKKVAAELLRFWQHLMRNYGGRAAFALLEELELSLTQVKALDSLQACGCSIPVKDLGERLGMSLPNASRTVEALLRRGYLERREDEQDRRIKRVQITPAGVAVLERVDSARLQGLETFTATLSESQRRDLLTALSSLPHAKDPTR